MKGFLLQSQYVQFWSTHFSLSNSTKRKYVNALGRFEAFLLQEGFQGELHFDRFHASRDHSDRSLPIKRSVIDRFFQYLSNQERMTESLLSATITGLKHFFGFLFDMDLISVNPMLGIPTPKYEKTVQNTALSMEECKLLLRAAIKRDPFYRQEFVLIWFMILTGLRISEVRCLRRSKLNLDTRIVYVSEGYKTTTRPVAISEDLANEIARYIDHPHYQNGANQGDEFLFHDNGEQFPYKKVAKILKKCSKEAGLTRIVRPHDLRRTTGYLMQIGGSNPIDIQRQLGHKDLATTLLYVPPLIDLAKILEVITPSRE
ncbi:tyrosine-type recombinase/integrase [Paenibacillus allorhizosphaerae]|uniref:Tyrosine recombinase XerC n=1 Tax=Paenibacillus allorhizosphaerae TaxID=2849866 RepID=A0ABN7TZR4_9BACL|nr:site-specific integrase [Paenibacillus allorhizosphaerae]CAG7658362.1 Tyrosine recombinase XerC [Paenibacillus allorhizosphaerae]